jgi:hypothetical protein
MYKAGEAITESEFDPSRMPKGHEFVNGRIAKIRKSRRPPDTWPEAWGNLSAKEKEKAIAAYEATLKKAADDSGASS